MVIISFIFSISIDRDRVSFNIGNGQISASVPSTLISRLALLLGELITPPFLFNGFHNYFRGENSCLSRKHIS